MANTVITIAREYGSGGRMIGKRLAEVLGIPFYDKQIIAMTAKQSGFTEEVVAQTEQTRTNSFLYGLYMTSKELPVSDQVFIAQSKIIRQLAKEGPCIIVGRCADYALREHDRCLRVFIHAPLADRVRRAREEYGKDEKNLETYVRRQDKKRASYYDYFSQKSWGKSQNYHLCIDSSIGIEAAVGVLREAAQGVWE